LAPAKNQEEMCRAAELKILIRELKSRGEIQKNI
jgi:hypothetical protein